MQHQTKKYVTRGIPVFLFGVGVIDVLLRCVNLESVSAGLLDAAHDPGKALFHVVLLPIAGYLLATCFTRLDFRHAAGGNVGAVVVWGTGIALLSGAIVYQTNDQLNGFFVKHAMPSEISHSYTKWINLRNFRALAWDEINRTVKNTIGEPEDSPARIKLKQTRQKKLEDYGELLKDLQSITPTWEKYFELASGRELWSGFASYLGVIFAVGLLWLTIILTRLSKPLDESLRSCALQIYSFLFLWIPLRIYSEWHGNFGSGIGQFGGLTAAIALAIFTAILLLVIGKPPKKVAITVSGIILTASLVGAVAPLTGYFSIAAEYVSLLSGPTIFAVYVMLCVTLLALVAYMIEDE